MAIRCRPLLPVAPAHRQHRRTCIRFTAFLHPGRTRRSIAAAAGYAPMRHN